MDQSLSNNTNKNMPSSNPENRATNPMTDNNQDDNVIDKQVRDTHHPDGTDVDVKTLIYIADKILGHVKTNAANSTSIKPRDVIAHQNAVRTLYSLSNITDKLACEMSRKRSSEGDGHTTTLSILHTVGNFHWEAKLALILACFALNHGEFWLLPQIMELSAPLKSKFDALAKLVHSVLESTRCIIQLKELPSTHLSADVPAMDAALHAVPSAVYWNVRGIMACAAQITSFTSMGISSFDTQPGEQFSLIREINVVFEFLKKQLEECNRVIEDRKDLDFKHLLNRLLETSNVDNMKILKILINLRDDPLPLFDGATKKRVSLEVLRRRNVLLLISGLDMSYEELAILEQIYSETRIQGSRTHAIYEVVWVPIVDPSLTYTEAMDIQFEDMKNNMPWYSVYHPSNVDRAVKKSIGDRWHFSGKPILVVLDPQGKELSPNAMHMMWIWGSTAFPFTTAREEALWRIETWRLELLVSGMDPTILDWVKQDKYIFLYGGDDIEWIRRFTRNAQAMASAAHIPLEMAYVGKSKKKKNAQRILDIINVEKLSYFWNDNILVWYFWTRLNSMLFSMNQLKRDDDQDPLMLKIKKLLSYEKEGSWALLSRGSQILTNGYGSTMLQTIVNFDQWKENIRTRGFDLSFKEYHDRLHIEASNCCCLEFPHDAPGIPKDVGCPECLQVMGKHISFLCCHD
ncbi:hypothetical protein SSX86_018880 [Deinandra increscens subsp. villosa]|uniref:Protein SIEVE ELEMENT OCCLUSION B-like n=1 Tax=Deinandra increscens subsp. villosa TaxID=3103831 RepID=A0AAP0CWU9_9ASTR